jgi:ArsR family transcriptional regulator
MLHRPPLSLDEIVEILRAAGEPTRLRLLALLSQADLTVSDLIEILGQSQPRLSRHLRLLGEAGLVERNQEGAWAYFRAADAGAGAEIAELLTGRIRKDDPQIRLDRERLEAVRKRRAEMAANYFSANAASWDAIRSLHADDEQVEKAMVALVGKKPFQAMLDLGTGTGRLLELFAPLYRRATGIDMSRDMLAVARANLDRAGLSRVQVRQGDIYLLPVPAGQYDLVTLHQVLHYLADPAGAIRQAARALAPGGRLLIVDFAPHEMEFLREQHQHARLGFSQAQVGEWLAAAGLDLVETVDITPKGAGGNKSADKGSAAPKLTVTLWLARDPRIEIAGGENQQESI